MTNYAGIDYSNGLSNVNHETNIHFGVINQSEVLQVWFDSNKPEYIFNCPHCGKPLENSEVKKCKSCKKKIDFDTQFDMIEPCAFTYNNDGYKCQQSADDTDIFVCESPYYTYAQYCSPCAPGAGSLMNYFEPKCAINACHNMHHDPTLFHEEAKKEGFPKVYCFGHDWFDDSQAPYPVFDVKTGELVKAPESEV